MDSYFATPERSDQQLLANEIESVTNNPVIDGLMKSISGLFAVLDKHRQILSVNDTLLEMMGVTNVKDVLGLRPGEALHCIHAHEQPCGCGTTKFCSSCGAAIAIVTSLESDSPVERTCALTVEKNDQTYDICFKVRSVPVQFEEHRFLLLFMQNITEQQTWAAIERTFFHDINNIMSGLLGATELLHFDDDQKDIGDILTHLVERLKKEIDIQRILSHTKDENYQVNLQKISLEQLIEEVKEIFSGHPASFSKSLVTTFTNSDISVVSDFSLLLRVIINMLSNAFEATDVGGEVKLDVTGDNGKVSINVWNDKAITDDIQLRIFQRHFSTKEGNGRGLGTYSMKLFGEQFLNGKVSFSSSEKDGTTFRFVLA